MRLSFLSRGGSHSGNSSPASEPAFVSNAGCWQIQETDLSLGFVFTLGRDGNDVADMPLSMRDMRQLVEGHKTD